MGQKRHTPEQIIRKLREAEIAIAKDLARRGVSPVEVEDGTVRAPRGGSRHARGWPEGSNLGPAGAPCPEATPSDPC